MTRPPGILASLLCIALVASARAGSITAAQDFAADADHAREQGAPIVVLVSATDCPYCEAVKSQVFSWMVDEPDYADVIFRVLEIDLPRSVVGFDGHEVSSGRFAARHGISITPTVLFLDEAGEELAEPLIGVGVLDLYAAYFDRSLRRARARITASEAGG